MNINITYTYNYCITRDVTWFGAKSWSKIANDL